MVMVSKMMVSRSAFNEGDITLADLLSTFPFQVCVQSSRSHLHYQNTFDVSSLLGRSLKLALEHSVSPMDSKVIFLSVVINIMLMSIVFIYHEC